MSNGEQETPPVAGEDNDAGDNAQDVEEKVEQSHVASDAASALDLESPDALTSASSTTDTEVEASSEHLALAAEVEALSKHFTTDVEAAPEAELEAAPEPPSPDAEAAPEAEAPDAEAAPEADAPKAEAAPVPPAPEAEFEAAPEPPSPDAEAASEAEAPDAEAASEAEAPDAEAVPEAAAPDAEAAPAPPAPEVEVEAAPAPPAPEVEVDAAPAPPAPEVDAAPAPPRETASPSDPNGHRVLGQLIQGADQADELALLFAEKAKDMAKMFVDKRRTIEAIEVASQKIERLGQEIASMKPAFQELASKKQEAEAMPEYPPPAVGLMAVGALIFVGCLLAEFIVVGAVIGGAIGGAGGFLYKKATDERTAAITEAQSKVSELQRSQSSLEQDRKTTEADKEALEATLASLKPHKTVDVVGRAYYPVKAVSLAGYSLILDRIGSHAPVELKIPDLVTDPDTVTRVNETVSRTNVMPTLLSPTASAGNEVDSLHGREAELKDAVDDFTDMVHSIAVHNRKLPLIEATSELTDLVTDDGLVVHQGALDGPMMVRDDSAEIDEAIETISDVAKRLRDVGGEADSVLRESYSQLNTNLVNYKSHRSHALDCLHSKFVDAMERASLLSVNSYCPKCNRVPQWLYSKLGVSLEEAHLVDQRQLLMRLNEDTEIANRLSNDDSLIRGLNASLRNIQLLADQLPEETGAMGEADQEMGASLSEYQAQLSRGRAIQGQLDVVLEEYRSVLRKILTGSSRPHLEVNHAARLHLDPVHGTWTCGACGAVYEDENEVMMGRLLKVKDNLMLPIWNHLWTEKEDFRKSELFRTNESLQRMSEKESEKLLALAESYKSDMRPVRENLIRYSAEADTKNLQLSDTIQGLQDMGYMTDEKAKEVRARINKMMGGAIGEAKASAEAKELLLSLEPQAQLNRRPSAADPINMLLSPKTLFLENEVLEHGGVLVAPEDETTALMGHDEVAAIDAEGSPHIGDAQSAPASEVVGGEHV